MTIRLHFVMDRYKWTPQHQELFSEYSVFTKYVNGFVIVLTEYLTPFPLLLVTC